MGSLAVAANMTSRVGVSAGAAAVAGGPWTTAVWTGGTTGPGTGACGWMFFSLSFISSVVWMSWITISACRGLTAGDHF